MPYGVLMKVAYDGTLFHGFVEQEALRTVASSIIGAVKNLDESIARISGTSRTDAGVHAEAQMIAFDATREIEPRGWVLGTNRHLPEDVAIRSATIVPAGFVPRFASERKRYRYRLHLDRVRDPFLQKRAWRIDRKIDLDALEAESRAIVGTHDFSAFRSAKDERGDTTRTMHSVTIDRDHDPRVVSIAITGSAFMHNMMRILVGTLVDVATGRLPRGTVEKALESHDRTHAGMTAPPHGLTLEHVELRLPKEVGESWPP